MDEPQAVQAILADLLGHQDVLGAIAVSAEGLVMGTAGVEEEDADVLGALGASLVGVAERTMRRLGAASNRHSVCVGGGDGMVHIWSRDDIAIIVLTDPCDGAVINQLADAAIGEIAGMLSLA